MQFFGESPCIYQAPGRVNLIGEHTDYNDGFVMPAAIGLYTRVAIVPRADRQLVIHSENYSERVEFDLDHLPVAGAGHWSDYVVGVVRVFGAIRDTGGWGEPAGGWGCTAGCGIEFFGFA